MKVLENTIESLYEALQGSEMAEEYSNRHGIESAAILTIYDDESAEIVAQSLAPRIEGKTVIEIGGGIGLLAFHLGDYAKHVYCIEANPAWSWTFLGCLFEQKPKNVSYLFGAATEFIGLIRGDVAVFCTHSGVESMRSIGGKFAPEVIDVYGEVLKDNPNKFDSVATKLREVV